MITIMQQPHSSEDVQTLLHPLVKRWFFGKYKDFSLPQLYGVKEVHDRNNILVSAPTGGTKTLTSFLSVLNELVRLDMEGKLENRVYAVYISPLKALNNDISINLERPLKEMKELAEQQGKTLSIRVGVRTGDTTPTQKQKMLRQPPHIMITTPESLAIMLSSFKFRELLMGVQWGIIDEIHALADNKRGVHLSLALEYLQRMSPELTRVGLSATVEPLENVARYLVGYANGKERDCKIAKVQLTKKFDLKVISPLPDLIDVEHQTMQKALYRTMHDLIQEHKTTLIFTNTRAGTERVVHTLKMMYPTKYIENIGAHHGSLSKKHRFEIEEKLRQGELKAVVCSTSLELGIDIGYVDLVVCLGSPKSVARFLQRAGRAGHSLHETVKGRLIVMDRDDLVECSLLLKNAIDKKIDRLHIPMHCLDVLAQMIYGMAITERWKIDELYDLVTRSYNYHQLPKDDFMEVIKYLAGEFVSLEDRYIFGKIWYDPESGDVGKRGKMARVIYMTNIGTIPEETAVKVKIKEQTIGTIDEGFLERLTRGDVFVLGGDTYEFLFSRGMVAQVKPSGGKLPTVPSWFSEMLPLSYDLAVDIQHFRRYIEDFFVNNHSKEDIIKYIFNTLYVDQNAAHAIYQYFNEQYLYASIPHDRRIIVEHYFDGNEKSKKYVVFHTLYGRRVNDVLSRALGYAIGKIQKYDVEIGITDNGFYVASKKPMQVMRAFSLLKSVQLPEIMKRAIEKSEVLKRRFRHCAARSLMILREYKGQHKHVGRQQVSSMILLNAVRRISDDFCILKEARREVLDDVMDLKHATDIIKQVEDEKIEIKQIHTSIPSPFAFNLVLQGSTDVMRMEEKVDFLRRMHQEVLAKIGKKHVF